jgi:hypothetical protein
MTADGLAIQDKPAEWATGWTPVPDRVIVAGEFEASLVTLTLPVTLPAAAGAKVALKLAVCREVRTSPAGRPLAVKPGPAMMTLEMLILALPEFVKVTPKTLLLPTVTFPKLRVDMLMDNGPEGALTVRVTALLVTLPAELLTVTSNCMLLSEVVVAGVV